MKKITLLFVLVFSTSVFSQNSLVGVYGSSEGVIYNQNEILMDPCSQSVPSNALENGLFFGGATNQQLAADIDVDADVVFSIETITFNTAGQSTNTTITFYEDLAGLPGDVIVTLDQVIDFSVVDEELIGNNFGFDFFQYTLELDVPLELIGATATGSKYWMQILSDATAWEATTAVITGLPLAFNNDNTAGLWSVSPDTEVVYSVSGQCDPVLSVGDNLLSLLSVYPNPTSDILKINVPASVEISNVSLFDLLGKNTGALLLNGSIDISNLNKGIYLLSLETNQGTLTQKIVKK